VPLEDINVPEPFANHFEAVRGLGKLSTVFLKLPDASRRYLILPEASKNYFGATRSL